MIPKKFPALLLVAALPLILLVPWTSGVHAEPGTKSKVSDFPIPLGKRCVVSVLSFYDPRAVVLGSTPSVPSSAEGNLIRMDSEWIVLRDGNNDYWISPDKVTIMKVSQ